jgi:hypothetical protein
MNFDSIFVFGPTWLKFSTGDVRVSLFSDAKFRKNRVRKLLLVAYNRNCSQFYIDYLTLIKDGVKMPVYNAAEHL